MKTFELGGALIMGLMGSVHCVGMCGPIAAVVCTGRGEEKRLLPQLGRIAFYVGLGAAAGALGSVVANALPFAFFQLGVKILAALLLVIVGFYTAGFLRKLGSLERVGSPLFRRVAGVFAAGDRRSVWGMLAKGLAWGLLPCGLVYGALGLATLSGSAGSGALVMVAFGLGTLPAMLAVTFFAEHFRRIVRHVRIRQAAGLLLAVAGTVHLALAIQWGRGLTSVARGPRLTGSFQPVIERPCCHHDD